MPSGPPHRLVVRTRCPPALSPRIKFWLWRRPPTTLAAAMSSWGNKWMAEWLEGLGRVTLLANESVTPILAFLAAVTVTCSTADGAAPPPAGPAWAWNLPIYETALDLATPHGKFSEFEQRLDALQDLGVGIIWFIPIFPTGGNPPDKPRSDSAYCVRDYYDVNPRDR